MNLKPMLLTLAQYNRSANFEIVKILKTLPEEKFTAPAGSYFKSIAGILNHVFAVDLNWMKRFKDNQILVDILEKELTGFTFRKADEMNFTTIGEFEILRRKLDNLIELICQKFPEDRLEKTVSFQGWDGSQKVMAAGGGWLHMFNHGTHHRGNISQILDSWNVDNDYSNLMRFFLE